MERHDFWLLELGTTISYFTSRKVEQISVYFVVLVIFCSSDIFRGLYLQEQKEGKRKRGVVGEGFMGMT